MSNSEGTDFTNPGPTKSKLYKNPKLYKRICLLDRTPTMSLDLDFKQIQSICRICVYMYRTSI